MKKLLETLFSTANNRIRNPFIGSFIFSWIVFNWKPISYFLFSDEKTRIKILFIEETYENVWNAVMLPLIFSLFYVLILPYLNQFIQSITFKAEKERRKKEQELKIENIGYLQESAEKEKILEDIRSGNRDIAQLNEKVTSLDVENQRLKETIQNKNEIISDYEEQIDKVTSDLQKANQALAEERRKKNSDSTNISQDNIGIVYLFLSVDGLDKYIDDIKESIENGHRLPNDKVPLAILNKFIDEGLVMKTEYSISGFVFTIKGESVLQYHKEKHNS